VSGGGNIAPTGQRWIVVVLALCALLYFLRLGDIAFLGKDEPKNAQAAREMLRSGDWVVTTLDEERWFDKPILYYWTTLVGYSIFGVGELGARVGPALAALLALWITYLLARRLLASGRHGGHAASAGALAALILGSGPLFFYYARTAMTDSLLTAFVTGCLAAYYFAREGIHPARNMHLAWACAALAVLAKGPVGLLLPALVIGADLLWTRRPGSLRRLCLPTGVLLFMALAGPWYALVTVRSEGQFLQDFLMQRNLARYTTDDLPHQGPVWYYLPVLLLAGYPWSLLLPGALMRLARRWKSLPAEERSRVRFLLLWMVLPTMFFSFAGSKLPSYLLPAFPAVAVLLARELCSLRAARDRAARATLAAGLTLVAVFSLGVAAGGAWYALQQQPRLSGSIPLLSALMLASLAALLAVALQPRRLAVPVLGTIAVVLPLVMVLSLLPSMEGRNSARQIALQAMELQPRPGQLLSYRFYDNSFFFYTDGLTERYYDLRWIEQRLDEVGGSGWCFVRAHDLPEVLGHDGLEAEDLGAVEHIHLLRLRSSGARQPQGDPPTG
jgi:4-amino-4-deoxy-L-arabinose transferase-like glycosyltransferase